MKLAHKDWAIIDFVCFFNAVTLIYMIIKEWLGAA